MKGFFIFLTLCIIAVGGIFIFDKALPTQIANFINYSPCNTAISYAIGSVDPRFNISRGEFSSDINQAATLWSQAEGKTLFSYSPSAELQVSLVYDQRQKLTTQISQLQQQVKSNQGELDQQISAYKAKEQNFITRLNDLNQQIESWNAKGGAPEEVFNQLIQQQKALKQEGEQLNQEAQRLNLSTQQYNTQVGVLNQQVTTFNQALARKPEEGLYDPQNHSITIYFDNSQEELIHTLAHELGHALGIGHVPDPNAIMYPYTSTNIALSQNDLQALQQVCKVQTLQYRIQTNTAIFLLNLNHVLHRL